MVGALRRFRVLLAAVALVPLLAAGSAAVSAAAPASPDGNGNGHGDGRDPVRILRDEYGVPHVYAASARSLFYGAGYAQAQDRLWQAEIHRRLATGTLSELFGRRCWRATWWPGSCSAR